MIFTQKSIFVFDLFPMHCKTLLPLCQSLYPEFPCLQNDLNAAIKYYEINFSTFTIKRMLPRIILPIRLKQLPNFINQMLIRYKILKKSVPAECKFHLCYFSCHSYFKYLYCALYSLAKNTSNHKIRVYIFNDNEQPLSEAQITAIRTLIPNTSVISWPKSMGWGSEQISSIWQAYKKVADQANDNDLIARVDSDVFFFNDTIFRAVSRSNADLVGDGHFVNFKYTQGGCYFLKASAVKAIHAMLIDEGVKTILNEIDIVVEDIAAYHFAQRLKLKIWMTWFMMFPDELRNSNGLTSWIHFKFSCVHFVMKNKDIMLKTYQSEVLQDQERESFNKMLNIK